MDTQNNTTIYTQKGFLEVCMSTKQSHQAFTKVEMFPTNWIGKTPGNKPMIMESKVDIVRGVNVMPLSTNQHVSPSEFDKQGLPIHGYGQDRPYWKSAMVMIYSSRV